MEFRYRAIDTNRPPPSTDTAPSPSPYPNSSFFPPRSIPGSSEDDKVREAIQREIEKEQIRQEIIIAEAARKRELISEVLQEMAIEREMAKRQVAETGMSLEEKITMWISQRKLSNLNQFTPMFYKGPYSLVASPMMQLPSLHQMHEGGTSLLESNKEKLNVLNRAHTIGAKGKEDTVGSMQLHEATGTSVLESNKENLIVLARADPVGEKRKADDDTQTGLNKPVKRKKHRADKAVLKAKTMSVETGEPVSSKLPCLGKLGSEKQVESKLMSFKFWCDICKVGTFCETVMRGHELGKKHKAAVTQQSGAPEAASASLAPASGTAPQSEATSVIETANVPAQKVDEMSVKETTGKKTEEGEKKKKVTFWCSTCNIHTNSETNMRNHRLGKKHIALAEKEKRKPIITVPVSAINAADPGEKESVSLAMNHTEGKGSLIGEKHMALVEKEQRKPITVPVSISSADPGEKELVSLAMEDDTEGKGSLFGENHMDLDDTEGKGSLFGEKHMDLVEKEQRKPIIVPVSAINAADPGEKESVSLAMEDDTEGKGSLFGENHMDLDDTEGKGSLFGEKHMDLVEKEQRKPIIVPVSAINAADPGEKESVSLAMEDDTEGKGSLFGENHMDLDDTEGKGSLFGEKHMDLVEKEQRKPIRVPVSAINAADPGEKESVSLAMEDDTEGKGSLLGQVIEDS